MSPRHNRRRRDEPQPARGSGSQPERHTGLGGDWFARTVPATAAAKQYICPGCAGEVSPGTTHVVAWAADAPDGVESRRHWHIGCWRARYRRRPIA